MSMYYSFSGYLLSVFYAPGDGGSAVNNTDCDDTRKS